MLSVSVLDIKASLQMSLDILDGQASQKIENSTSLLIGGTLLLVDWCAGSPGKYSYVNSVWPESHHLFFPCHLPNCA